jgi:hypothetical protein
LVEEHPARPQQAPGSAKVLRQQRLAHVLEHSHTDQLVILLFRQFAIVTNINFAAVREAGFSYARSCQFRLTGAECDAKDANTVVFGGMHDQAAPSATKIKNAIARPQPQLPANVVQFLRLGCVQAVPGNKKELFCARIEDIDWNNRVFFIPDSKTDNGRRFVPLSDRALERLEARCGERREGWIFPAFSASGHLTTVDKKFRQARLEAGLPEKLVLYCGRHDYGTRVLQGTGNLAVVMRTMGHGSPSTAMKYQQVRRVLNGTNSNYNPEQGLNGTFYGTVTKQ